jgi:hypothetical protein
MVDSYYSTTPLIVKIVSTGIIQGCKGKKVKLSLCTEHHAMKAYWGNGGVVPRIL